jgi:hypothetical protein
MNYRQHTHVRYSRNAESVPQPGILSEKDFGQAGCRKNDH